MRVFGFCEVPILDDLMSGIGFEEVKLNAFDDVAFLPSFKSLFPIGPLLQRLGVLAVHLIRGVTDFLEEQPLFLRHVVKVFVCGHWSLSPRRESGYLVPCLGGPRYKLR